MTNISDCHTHVIDLFQVKIELQDVMLTHRVDGVYKPCFEALSRELTVHNETFIKSVT